MVVHDPVVMPIALEMLDCLEQEIAKVENPPTYVGLRAGDVVDHLLSTGGQDECCEGLAWVRPASFWPSSGPFPVQDEAPVNKGGPLSWVVTLELGAVRCAPTPEAHQIPSVGDWNAVVQAIMDDAAAFRRAVCCFIDANPAWRRGRVLVGAWQPIPIEGGCVGGVLPVQIQGPACDCHDAGPES